MWTPGSDLVNQPIPARDAGGYRWMTLHGAQDWFYALPRIAPNLGSVSVSLKTLDPALRGLVSRLHARNIATLPSCQGHFDPRRIDRANEQLLAQAWLIRRGCTMVDVESGVQVPIWRPTWAPRLLPPSWLAEMSEGYLGVAARGPWYHRAASALRSVRGVQAEVHGFGPRWLDVRVRASSPTAQRAAWGLVEEILWDAPC